MVSHGFCEMCESHKQDGETLSLQHGCKACQRPAILPWPSNLPFSYERATAHSTIGSVAAG
jgi:hypothetical protein